jgi:hypothetical protein
MLEAKALQYLRFHFHNVCPTLHRHGLVGKHTLQVILKLFRLPRPKIRISIAVVPNHCTLLPFNIRSISAFCVLRHHWFHDVLPLEVQRRSIELLPLIPARHPFGVAVPPANPTNTSNILFPMNKDAIIVPTSHHCWFIL